MFKDQLGENDSESLLEDEPKESPIINETETEDIIADINPVLTNPKEKENNNSQSEIMIEIPEEEPESESNSDSESDLDDSTDETKEDETIFGATELIIETKSPYGILNLGPEVSINPNKKGIVRNTYDYDVIVIGGGVGGYAAAQRLQQLDFKTLIVEKEAYGGTCLNQGCIPLKVLLKSAKRFHQTCYQLKDFGINLASQTKISVNWSKMQQRKDKIVRQVSDNFVYSLNKNKITHLHTKAQVLDNKTILIDETEYSVRDIIIATGSKSQELKHPGFDQGRKTRKIINSTQALALKKIPPTVLIIGGGIIAIEFACLYQNLGCDVTIIENKKRLLEQFDYDIAQEMTKILKEKLKIKVFIETQIIKYSSQGLEVKINNRLMLMNGDVILDLSGRKPNKTGLEALKLEFDKRGFIKANESGHTNILNVYAIGDVTGGVMTASLAHHQGLAAATEIAAKYGRLKYDQIDIINNHQIPLCLYSNPEIGAIGYTEQQCLEQKIDYNVLKIPFENNDKALAESETIGFVKLISDSKNNQILGCHIIGKGATELINEMAIVIHANTSIAQLAQTIFAFPTMSSTISDIAQALWEKKTPSLIQIKKTD